MDSINLKLNEFYLLEAEINGSKNKETNEVIVEGLLNEKIKLTTKYWLTDLYNKISVEVESLNKLRDSLVLKYATVDSNGNYSIPFTIDKINENNEVEMVEQDGVQVPLKVVNPAYINYQNEINELLNQEKEIYFKPFKLEEFENVVTTYNYNVIFKLIEKGTN